MARTGPADALEAVRRGLAGQVRGLLGGSEGRAHFEVMAQEAGPRWFDEDRPILTVHSDAAMFVGGLRALLLQSMHPLAMAGVAQHSNYREDPWGRLTRTAEFLTATTFGTAERAEEAVAIVHRVHQRVVGTVRDGRPYSANDPHLMAWVHAVETDSFLASHQRYGARRLTVAEADGYVTDMAVVARALGVERPATTVRALQADLRAFRPELVAGADACSAARYLLVTPPLPAAARAPYALVASAAASLLPLWVRLSLRIPMGPVGGAVVGRPAGNAVTRALRWVLSEPPRQPVPR